MRKWIAAVLAMLCTLGTGCVKNEVEKDAQLNSYKAYYDVVLDSKSFIEQSDFYSLSVEMAKVDSRTFRYYVFVDEPKVAMNSCRIMVVEDDLPYSEDKIMPSVGITDTAYSLVPGQVNPEEGFAKGLIASGETDHEDVRLRILVEWTGRNSTAAVREFYNCSVTTEGAEFVTGTAQE